MKRLVIALALLFAAVPAAADSNMPPAYWADRQLPDATAEGDVVLLADAGAYGMVMASRYNLRALPAEEILE